MDNGTNLSCGDDPDWNGVAWSYSMDTIKDKFITVKVPFRALKPTRFAKVLQNFRPYNKSQITAIQLRLIQVRV